MSTTQLPIDFARRAGEEGIRASTEGAEARSPGITDLMYAFLVKFARAARRSDRFTAEEITVAYARDPVFEQPKDMRSWGGVFLRATHNEILAIADYEGTRTLGHGVKGAKRYRSLVSGKRATEVL